MNKKRIKKFILYFASILLSLPIIIPLYMMIVGSFKSIAEAARMDLKLPSKWLFENYSTVIIEGNLLRAFLNSVLITFTSVIIIILFSSLAAFYFARNNSKLSKYCYSVYILGLIAPLSIVPTIKLMQVLGIMGTYLSIILLFCATSIPLCTFLITGFIKSIPRELDEAAVIDGCDKFSVFFRIIFPLLFPIIATASIITFMVVWNSFILPLYFLDISTKWTMPLTVYNFFGQYSSSWNLVFADLVLTALPVMIFYIICQKYIIKSMVEGAVKG